MIKKKILMLSAITSLLVVGTGAAVASTTDAFGAFAGALVNNNEKVTTGFTIWKSDKNETTAGGKVINYEFTENSFELKSDFQKIQKIDLLGSHPSETVYFQAGYKSGNPEHPYYYTDKQVLNIGLEGHVFEPGLEPAVFKVFATGLEGFAIDYACENRNENNYNSYPAITGEDWYVVGSGSFLNPDRPAEWSEVGGVKCTTDTAGVISATLDVKKGDVLRFKKGNSNSNDYYTINNLNNCYYYDKTISHDDVKQNITINNDAKITLTLNAGNLTVTPGQNTEATIKIINTDESNEFTGSLYLRGNYNNWGDGIQFVQSGNEYTATCSIDKSICNFQFKITDTASKWDKQINNDGKDFSVDLNGYEKVITIKANLTVFTDKSVANGQII